MGGVSRFSAAVAAAVRRSRFLRIVAVVSVASALWLALLVGSLYTDQARTETALVAKARADTQRAAAMLDADLKRMMTAADAFARELSERPLGRDEIQSRLVGALTPELRYFAYGVAFEPFAHDPGVRLYGPYNVRQADGRYRLMEINDLYDYTDLRWAWYQEPKKIGKATWIEPYWAEAARSLVANYSAPIMRDGKFAGAVVINFSLNDIRGLVASLELGGTGYGFVLSKAGAYITHPEESLVRERKSVFDVTKHYTEANTATLKRAVETGAGVVIEQKAIATGQESLIVLEPVRTAGWLMGITFIKAELDLNPQTTKRFLLLIMIAATMMIASLTVLAIAGAGRSRAWIRGGAVVAGTAFAASLYICWQAELRLSGMPVATASAITDGGTLNNFKARWTDASRREKGPTPAFIPMGVDIQSIKPIGLAEVNVMGVLWQRFTTGDKTASARGVHFPDATSARFTELYRKMDGNTEVIGSTFDVTLRQRLDNSKYPFDRIDIGIRIRHKDPLEPVILVPDLDSYGVLSPTSVPFIERNVRVPGWDLTHAYFTYDVTTYRTGFGVGGMHTSATDLLLKIGLQRKFLEAFVITIIPILVVLAILFAMLVMSTGQREKLDGFGQKPVNVINTAAALCLFLVIATLNLRSRIVSEGIIYIEYLYFVAYFMILVVAANALIFSRRVEPASQAQDDRESLASSLFWPAVFAVFFAVTVATFYP